MSMFNIDPVMEFDPDYQQNLYLIESAMQEVGLLPKGEPESLPNRFDEQLRALIEAVPLE